MLVLMRAQPRADAIKTNLTEVVLAVLVGKAFLNAVAGFWRSGQTLRHA